MAGKPAAGKPAAPAGVTEANFDYDFYRANTPKNSKLRDAKKWNNKLLWGHWLKSGKTGTWRVKPIGVKK